MDTQSNVKKLAAMTATDALMLNSSYQASAGMQAQDLTFDSLI